MPHFIGSALRFVSFGPASAASKRKTLAQRPRLEPLESRSLLSGNVFVYNPPSTNEPFTQSNPVKVTNSYGTETTFKLSITSTGTGAGILSPASVTLAAGATTFVKFTPTADSSTPDDVHLIAHR